MTDEEKKAAEAKAKADAEGDAGTKLDKVLEGLGGVVKSVEGLGTRIDDVSSRVDALEGSDSKRAKADAELKARNDEYGAMAEAQAKADTISNMFGRRAPRHLDGETLLTYRRRLCGEFKPYSADWKDIDLSTITDSVIDIAEKRIYADAEHAARDYTHLPAGRIHEIITPDATGRRISTFHSSDGTTIFHQMKPPAQRVSRFLTRRGGD